MAATQAQYDAATKALETFAYNMINAKLTGFKEQFAGEAKEMADEMCPQAAKVAVDAALAVPSS